MKKCLLIIDYQNDFVTGALGFPEAATIAPRLIEKIKECRKNGYEVMFTLDSHGEDYSQTQEGKKLPVIHCVMETAGHALAGDIANLKEPGDKCFNKPTFGSDELYRYLKENRYDEIELAGVVTDICVIANAVLAKTAQPETRIVIDAQCVASNDPARHAAALDVMRSLQIDIITEQT